MSSTRAIILENRYRRMSTTLPARPTAINVMYWPKLVGAETTAKVSRIIAQNLFKQSKLTNMKKFEISSKLPDRRQEYHDFIQELKLVCVVLIHLREHLSWAPRN